MFQPFTDLRGRWLSNYFKRGCGFINYLPNYERSRTCRQSRDSWGQSRRRDFRFPTYFWAAALGKFWKFPIFSRKFSRFSRNSWVFPNSGIFIEFLRNFSGFPKIPGFYRSSAIFVKAFFGIPARKNFRDSLKLGKSRDFPIPRIDNFNQDCPHYNVGALIIHHNCLLLFKSK